MTLDEIHRLLRICHKYDAEQYFHMVLPWLKEYPTTNCKLVDLYDHPNWKLEYRDPQHLVKLIHVLELLNMRELDGTVALALYKLAVVDWDKSGQQDTLTTLSSTATKRLIVGQQRLFKHYLKVKDSVRNKDCWG